MRTASGHGRRIAPLALDEAWVLPGGLMIRVMPLRDSALAAARSLILRRRPGASDKCISAVYSLIDMPWSGQQVRVQGAGDGGQRPDARAHERLLPGGQWDDRRVLEPVLRHADHCTCS